MNDFYGQTNMKNFYYLLLILLSSACDDSEEITDESSTFQKTTIQYNAISGVDDNLLSLDIYHSDDVDTEKPVIFYVHGGAWSLGDKANDLDNKITLSRELDYILISINYRLSPISRELDDDRIKYPIHSLDVADAFKWTVDNINNYGGDPDKIVLLGHSAGAQLVSLLGTNERFLMDVGLDLSSIRGVASIDTEGYDVRSKVLDGDRFYINAFGINEDENNDASPIRHVFSTTRTPKFFIAKRGETDRIAIANDFINVLEQNGVEIDQIEASQYTHMGINDAIGRTGETAVTEPLIAFFRACFE